jgi:hypothetical protein
LFFGLINCSTSILKIIFLFLWKLKTALFKE